MYLRPVSAATRPVLGVGFSLLLFAGLACSSTAAPSSARASAPAAPAATSAAAAPAATIAPAAAAAAAKPTTAPAAATTAPAAANQNLIIAIDQSDVKTLDPAREF
jgi:hypothetical protein